MKNKIFLWILLCTAILIIGVVAVNMTKPVQRYQQKPDKPENFHNELEFLLENHRTESPLSDEDMRNDLLSKYRLIDMSEYSALNTKADCLGYLGDYPDDSVPGGGDIIIALKDDTFRSLISLNIFTPTYITNLEVYVRSKIKQYYSKEIFIVSACHLDTDLDLITGYLGTRTNNQENLRAFRTNEPEQPVVILVNNSNVHVFEEVRTRVGNATGSEGGPCEVTLVDDDIKWTCFIGLGVDEETQTTHGAYESWLFSRNGEMLQNW